MSVICYQRSEIFFLYSINMISFLRVSRMFLYTVFYNSDEYSFSNDQILK